MSKKLLPCPFCGGEARLTAAMGETWMRCIDCNAGSEMSGSRALAIAAWNRRAPAPEGEAWGYATRRIAFADGTKVDGPWGLDTGLSLDMARTDPCWEVQPLYASPVVPVGSGEAGVYTQADYEEAAALGERDGYEKAVQDIDLLTGGDGEYKATTHDGVIDMPVMKARIIQRFSSLRQLVVPVGVSREEIARALFERHWSAVSASPKWPGDDDGSYWLWLADAILAALRPADTGRE